MQSTQGIYRYMASDHSDSGRKPATSTLYATLFD